jgi:hypothetical protein
MGQDDRAGCDQGRLRDGKPHESEREVGGIGAQLKQPMHVDPRPTGRAQGEGIHAKQCVPLHHFASRSEMPIDVAVGNGPKRGDER